MLELLSEAIPNSPLDSIDPDLAVGLVLVGGYLCYTGWKPLYWAIVLWRSEPTSVLSAGNTDGIIELEGTAIETDDRLESPFTGTPCLAYEYEIQEYRSSNTNNSGGSWKTIHTGGNGVPFRLEDDTGGLLVDPETATLSFSSGDTITVSRGETADEPIASFLETIDVDPGAGTQRSLGPITVETGDRRCYCERRLEDGEDVHVYGPLERNPPIDTSASDFNAAVRDEMGAAKFFVSDTDESATIGRSFKTGAKALLGGPLLIVGTAVLLLEVVSTVGV